MKNEKIKVWALNKRIKTGTKGRQISLDDPLLDLVIEKARQAGADDALDKVMPAIREELEDFVDGLKMDTMSATEAGSWEYYADDFLSFVEDRINKLKPKGGES